MNDVIRMMLCLMCLGMLMSVMLCVGLCGSFVLMKIMGLRCRCGVDDDGCEGRE